MSLKQFYCRTFQFVFDKGARLLPWRKPVCITGEGSFQRVPSLLAKAGAIHPMIVASRRQTAAEAFAVMAAQLPAYSVFSDVEANPSVGTVEAIAARYRLDGCDSIIAIGGGSPMDAAKAAGALIVRPGKSLSQMGGLMKVGCPLPPFVAVPTTAGTGSETTIAAVITDSATHHKYAVNDLHLIPRWAVLDPELTLSLPPAITAQTGMDALTHALEAYVSWTYNTKETLHLAEEAVCGIFRYLETAYRDGSDLKARQELLLASYRAGFAFTRAGVGNVHAIAHTLGGLYNTPHGLANAVILPVVLEDYGEVIYPKLARLAELTGVAMTGSDQGKATAFLAAIRGMNRRMRIPEGFSCIRDEDIPRMISWADAEANPVYPVPVFYDPQRFYEVIQKIRL